MHWWKRAKIYELYVDKFAGDLRGLAERLWYFEKLGVNALHLLPHYPHSGVDDGYDVTDYRGVREELGTLKDFKNLVEAARRRGIRIIVDFVLNHTSRMHPWFLEARESADNSRRDFYVWSKTGEEYALAHNPFPDFKRRNWIYSSETDDYYYATYYPGQPDLNWDNPAVFDAMLSHMEFWAALGVSGFRLDAAPYLVKRDGTSCKGLPETHAVLKRMRAQLERSHPEVILLAEAHESLPRTKEYFGAGDECHMAYHFPLMEAFWMEIALGRKGRTASTAARSLNIPENCQWATFLRNHDEISLSTLTRREREKLVAALDPNARYPFKNGETTSMRLATALKNNRAKILEAFRLLYGAPGAPVMYYGDELGMQNEAYAESPIDTRTYVRGHFDWREAERQTADPESLWSETATIVRTS